MIERSRGPISPETPAEASPLPPEPRQPEREQPEVEALDVELQRMERLGRTAIERLRDAEGRDPSFWERVKFHTGDTVIQLYELAMTASGVTAATVLGRAAEREPRFLLPALAFGLGCTLAALSMEKTRQVRSQRHPGRP
ncbi:hypothetical protein HY635_00590 [Candidatus Uhrbacteria bacterium]|nr:hypothetical protein [Candidatus Uhrbacteria bacterium]